MVKGPLKRVFSSLEEEKLQITIQMYNIQLSIYELDNFPDSCHKLYALKIYTALISNLLQKIENLKDLKKIISCG